jgi:hypothetical protein
MRPLNSLIFCNRELGVFLFCRGNDQFLETQAIKGRRKNNLDHVGFKIRHSLMTLSVLALLFAAEQVHAQIEWANTNSTGNWSDPTQWNPHVVPDDGESAGLPDGAEVVTLDYNPTIGDLSVGEGATLQTDAGVSLTADSLENYGMINFNSGGTFTVNGAATNSSGFEISDGTTMSVGTDLSNTNGFLYASNGASVSIGGNVTNTATFETGAYAGAASTVTVSGTFTNATSYVPYAGLYVSSGGDVVNVGALSNQGYVSISEGATLNITGGGPGVTDVPAGSKYIIQGSFNAVGENGTTSALSNLASVEGELILENGQTNNISGPITISPGTLFSSGTFLVGRGTTLSITGDVTNNGYFSTDSGGSGSTITVDGTLTNTSTGQISLSTDGDAAKAGAFNNAGFALLTSGTFLGVGSGTFSASSGYQQLTNGILNEIITNASTCGGIDVVGPAVLGGTLSVTYNGTGTVPAPTSGEYRVLTANSITGTFNNGSNLVRAGTGFLKVNYSSTSVTLQPTDVITFYDEYPGNGSLTGHAFLEMTSVNGTSAYYGFYPYENPISDFTFSGYITSRDSATPWNFDIAYPVSQAAYDAASALILQDSGSPPLYSLIAFNCTDWISTVAAAAGIQLPQTKNDYGISDPYAFGNSLLRIGNGNSLAGGTVTFNSVGNSNSSIHVAEMSSGAAPYDYSFTALEEAGHTSPSGLASTLGFPLDQVNLGTVNANNVSGLLLNLIGADPTEDLISINWGDGSPYQGQSLTFSHMYSPGTYSADLLEVDDGAVHSYDMTIEVSSASSTPIDITVTPFPTVDDPNPGLTPALPVPEVPEPASGLLTVAFCVIASRRRYCHKMT